MTDPPAPKQITLLIAGRPYPLRIAATDEAAIRQVARDLNERVNRFQLKYPNRDKQDCLAMVLLTYAADLYQPARTTVDPATVRRLAQLNATLAERLAR